MVNSQKWQYLTRIRQLKEKLVANLVFYFLLSELTPIIYLVDFPVSIATGRMPVDMWPINFIFSIGWCFVMWILGTLVYNKGIKSYEAYGS